MRGSSVRSAAKRAVFALVCLPVLLALIFLAEANIENFGKHTAKIVGDGLSWRLRWYAGPGAVNCGSVRVFENPQAATRCATDARAAGRAFHVRYYLQGMDAELSVGIVGTRDGDLRMFKWIGDPRGTGRTSMFWQRTVEMSCPVRRREWPILYVSPEGRACCQHGATPFGGSY